MDHYWHCWTQGWKFHLAMLIFNFCAALTFVPLPHYIELDKPGHYAIAVPVYVMFLVPIGSCLYCVLKPHRVNESDDGAKA